MWHRLADELRLREHLRDREFAPKQVLNSFRDEHVTPVSQARGDAVKAAWGALLPGQAVPLINESFAEVTDAERLRDCG